MSRWKPVPLELNGFKIVKDLGSVAVGKERYVVAICKVCNLEFKTNLYLMHRKKSCGCLKQVQLKPLPKIINGFTVVEDLGYGKERKAIVECKVCGNPWEVNPRRLGRFKSCGCRRDGKIISRYTKDYPRLMGLYSAMKARCYNGKNKCYCYYGAKGITVCDEWLDDSNKFCEWALENGYDEQNKRLSIDRVDNSASYCPDNCRWVDITDQSRHTSRNVMTIEIARKIREERGTMPTKKLAEKYGVSHYILNNIFYSSGWKDI